MTGAFLRSRYIGLALGLALVLGCFPTPVWAGMVGSLDSGGDTPSARQMQEARIQRLLAQTEVSQALEKAGLNASEIGQRLDRLDDQQLGKLASSLETIKAGKGGAYVLVGLAVLLLIVLIYMQIEAA
jgi:hypothetical protein